MISIIKKNNLDCVVPKKWGEEIIIHNDENYCGKILKFNAGAKFSKHFHLKKIETWYVVNGVFTLNWIDPTNATEYTSVLGVGDIIEIGQGDPHQLISHGAGEIFEVSTQHFDNDSYRIAKGDSQK